MDRKWNKKTLRREAAMEPVCVWVCWILGRGLKAGLSVIEGIISIKYGTRPAVFSPSKNVPMPLQILNPPRES